MIYKRTINKHNGWKNILLPIVFIFIPVILVAILDAVFLGGSLESPVSLALFGRYFVWTHVVIISIFIGGIIAMMLVSKRPSFQPHALFFVQQEKLLFSKKYHLAVSTNEHPKGSWVYIVLMMLSTFIPLPVYLLYKKLLPQLFNGHVASLIAFAVMAVPFYSAAKKLMAKHSDAIPPILDELNQHLPQTHLKNSASNLSYSIIHPGLQVTQSINGTFKGYRFSFDSNVAGGMSRHARVSGRMKSTIYFSKPLHKKMQITITEKKSSWRKIQGDAINDCFQQRFKVQGLDVTELPQQFKELCLAHDRSLYLTITDTAIEFNTTNLSISPAYSIFGQILFIDFLIELAEALNIKKVEAIPRTTITA